MNHIKLYKICSTIFLIVFLFLSLSNSAFPSIYYISTIGDDSWNGEYSSYQGGTNGPWKTTEKANDTLIAGDTVYFREGTYIVDSFIAPKNSGSQGNLITYSVYNNEPVIVTNQRITNHDMELDSSWNNLGSPTTNEQSSAQAWDGSYSRKFSVNAANEGIKSTIFSQAQKGYVYSAWVYSDQSAVNIYVVGGNGEVIKNTDEKISANKWSMVTGFFNGILGPNGYIAFRSPTGVSTGSWYVDNVRVHYNGASIFIKGKEYIKVDGIDFDTVGKGFDIQNGSNFNEIANCTFSNMNSESFYVLNRIWDNNSTRSTNNWVHDCTFANNGSVYWTGTECQDRGDVLRIGGETGDESSNNLIENNLWYGGGHSLITMVTNYNVIRGNTFHNEGWMKDNYNGACDNNPLGGFGNRNLATENIGNSDYNLIEDNRFGHAGSPPDDDEASGLNLTTDYNILRYNYFFGNGMSGIYLKRLATGTADHNRIYNNTLYKNGGGVDINSIFQSGIHFRCPGDATEAKGNIGKNNLLYDNIDSDYNCGGGNCGDPCRYTTNTFTDNWTTKDGNPNFVDPTMSDKTSLTLPNLSLQSDSGAINSGTYLTQTNGSGSSTTTLLVEDASYFQDGTWGPPVTTLKADHIAIGTVNNTVQIASINYHTNTITLSSEMTWTVNSKVWLFKDSKGKTILLGEAPDYGAHEYTLVPIPESFSKKK